jgi:hypothetical protein
MRIGARYSGRGGVASNMGIAGNSAGGGVADTAPDRVMDLVFGSGATRRSRRNSAVTA